MKKQILLFALASLMAGCAAGPSLSELRGGAHSATFVQQGREPVQLGFGVVDTASFWATYGSGVSSQLGGGYVWRDLEQAGRADAEKRAPTAADVMGWLYNRHPLVDQTSAALMPKLATLWSVSYNPAKLRVVDLRVIENKDGHFTAFSPTTDLVIVYSVNNLRLTERFTVGNALLAGVTFGTNTKNVTAEIDTFYRVYKRDPASGVHKRVWLGSCGVHSMYMTTDFPFPEVVKSQEKAKQLWDEASAKTIELCTKHLGTLAENERKLAKQ